MRFFHRWVGGEFAIGEARRVPQQIVNRHLAIRRDGRVRIFSEFGVSLRDTHLHILHRRQMFRHRIVKLQLAVFNQQHRRDRHHRFGHRVDAENRVLRHRRRSFFILKTDRFVIDQLIFAHDHHHCARQLALFDFLFEHLGDFRESLGGKSHRGRRGWRRGLRIGAEHKCCKNENH